MDNSKKIQNNPSAKKKELPWFDVKIGDPCSDGKSQGTIVIREGENGPLMPGTIQVSSNRKFAIAENEVLTGTEKKRWYEFPVPSGQMLVEVEMTDEPDHLQQHLYFMLVETGEVIEIFLVKMKIEREV